MGEGERQTELVWIHSGNGIVADITKDRPGTSQKGQFRLANVTISNTAATSGTAVRVFDTAYDSGGIINTVILENVTFNVSWSKAVEFDKCRQIKVNNLSAFLNAGTEILHLKDSCVDSTFSNMHIGVGSSGSNNIVGMLIDGHADIGNEGVRISDSTFLKCNIGVHHDGSAGQFEPHLDIGGCHMNCQTNCVKLTDVGQSFIHDNLFFAWITGADASGNPPPQSEFKDNQIILVTGNRGGEQLLIHNNSFHALGRGTFYPQPLDIGIKWESPISRLATNISDNVFAGVTRGIEATGGGDQLTCQNNVFDSNISGGDQFKATSGNINDFTLIDGLDANGNPTNHLIHAVRSKGSTNKSVSLRLQNNNNNLYITQNANSDAQISFKNDLTFNTNFGTSTSPIQSMKFHTNGDVEVYHRLLIYNQSKSQRYEIYVDGSGNVKATPA